MDARNQDALFRSLARFVRPSNDMARSSEAVTNVDLRLRACAPEKAAVERRAITTAVLNPKGRSGKTTTAVNFAAALVKQRRRTLLVDIDAQARATVHLGVGAHSLQPTLFEILSRIERSPEKCVRAVRSGISLIPSGLRLVAIERDLLDHLGRDLLRQRIKPLKDQFEHIILDCPSSLGALSVTALCAADEIIMPVCADDFALDGLKEVLDTLELLQARLAKDIRITGVLITQHDGQTGIARTMRHAVKNHGLPVFQTVIRRNVRLQEAASYGRDIFAYAPGAAGAEDYLNLALEYLS